jgi:ribokinase
MAAKIVVVGSFNMDLVILSPRLPHVGETVAASRFFTGPGGKGSNQAVAAARLGANVTFVGRIGQDAFGDAAMELWKGEGINTQYVVRDPKAATGVASIMVDNHGENMIAVALGANSQLTREDVDAASDAIESADVMLIQLEIDHTVAAYALRLARKLKTPTILNPAPATNLPMEILVYPDYLTPNEGELEQIYGEHSIYEDDSADYLLASDEQVVIVTMGAQGARWISRGGTAGVPTFPVDVIDTTGAGDAFNGALAVALAEGQTVTDAITFANATAALCVTRAGATGSMPPRNSVEALLRPT